MDLKEQKDLSILEKTDVYWGTFCQEVKCPANDAQVRAVDFQH